MTDFKEKLKKVRANLFQFYSQNFASNLETKIFFSNNNLPFKNILSNRITNNDEISSFRGNINLF